MKRIVRWALLAGVGGPGLLTLSCSGMLLTEARDAVFSAFGTSVETAATAFLTDALGLVGTMAVP